MPPHSILLRCVDLALPRAARGFRVWARAPFVGPHISNVFSAASPAAVPRATPASCATASASGIAPKESRAASSSARAERIVAVPGPVSKDVQEYWEQMLAQVDKTTAKKLLPCLDLSVTLGISQSILQQGPRIPILPFYLKTKEQHPKHVLLVRVGEFYEAVGSDAVLAVQHCGLNPMVSKDSPDRARVPRAGCPLQNLRRTVDDLLRAGLSVVVCEEAPAEYSYGSRAAKAKQRYVASVVTPASPHVAHGLVDEGVDVAFEDAPPLVAIAAQGGSLVLLEARPELRRLSVMEGLTEDAVLSRVYKGGLVPPLVLLTPDAQSPAQHLSQGTTESVWERRLREACRAHVGAMERASLGSGDPARAMLSWVRRHVGLPPDAPFAIQRSSVRDRPRPTYRCTALNLGLLPSAGVPSLLDAAAGTATPLASKLWLKRLLLAPPPPAVARATQRACRVLASAATGALPALPVMSAVNVVVKLQNREATDTFFRELADLCAAVAKLCGALRGSPLAELAAALLPVVQLETGVGAKREHLFRECAEAERQIRAVVMADDEWQGEGGAYSSDQNVGLFGKESGEPANFQMPDSGPTPSGLGEIPDPARCQVLGSDAMRQHLQGLDALLAVYSQKNELFWNKVRESQLSESFAAVRLARAHLAFSLRAFAVPVMEASLQAGDPARARPVLHVDEHNNALWMRIPAGAAAAVRGRLKEVGGMHPADRFGKSEPGEYSTPEVEAALQTYRFVCHAASRAVADQLRALAGDLQPRLASLTSAATMALVAVALERHVSEALRLGWCFPELVHGVSEGGRASEGRWGGEDAVQGDKPIAGSTPQPPGSEDDLSFRGLWPYWLDGRAASTVPASFELPGAFLLTGPNMAGKSTTLRSTAAAALLGSCGLLVPAASARLPYLDAIMLRNFSADAPLEGRSSFAVEMTEVRYVLEDVSPRSLVLVDELCRGTEVQAGSALAGAFVERLDAAGCRAIFATHLHALLDLPLRLRNTRRMRMEVLRGPDGRLEPTLRMLSGECTQSLALEVARDSGVPADVLRRAEQLVQVLEPARVVVRLHQGGVQDAGGSFVADSLPATPPIDHSPASPPPPVAQFSLESAAQVLEDVALSMLESLAPPSDADAGILSPSAPWTAPPPQSQVVEPKEFPPPHTVGASCVYVLRRTDGWFYVGSSDALRQRLAAHRRRSGGSQVRDPGARAAYVRLPEGGGGSSAAKAVEAALIKALGTRGYPLLSIADAKLRNAPSARSDPDAPAWPRPKEQHARSSPQSPGISC